MKKIIIEEKYVPEYVMDMLSDCKTGRKEEVKNAKFHHNTNYEKAANILRYGILPLRELNRLGLRHDSEEFLELMDDIESHINGIDGVSLFVTGLDDTDPDKLIFNSKSNSHVDFLVTSDIIAGRCGSNYDDEYICRRPITPDLLRAMDIRLLSYAKEVIQHSNNNKNVNGLIERYNYLKEIALTLKETGLGIPFREVSDDNSVLDADKVSTMPTLTLKK